MDFKIIIVLGLSLLVTTVHAGTVAKIEERKAIVMVQGPPGDLDAPKLFAAMNTTAVDRSGVFNKELHFKSSDSEQLFDLVCNVSKTVPNYGSCTFTIAESTYVTFDPLKKNFIFMISGPDAWNIVRNFGPPDAQGSVYTSKDGSLSLRVDEAGTSTESFRVWFVTTTAPATPAAATAKRP